MIGIYLAAMNDENDDHNPNLHFPSKGHTLTLTQDKFASNPDETLRWQLWYVRSHMSSDPYEQNKGRLRH